MKKFLSLLLAACLCLSVGILFASCDDEGSGKPEATGVTREQWEAAVQKSTFDNVTLSYTATFSSDNVSNKGPHTIEIKLDGFDAERNDKVLDLKDAVDARYLCTDAVVAMATDFDKYKYNAEKDCYEAVESISYTVNVMDQYVATITPTNVSIELDESLRIAKISCHMVQSILDMELILDVVFTFSDYGTTVVEW